MSINESFCTRQSKIDVNNVWINVEPFDII